MCPEGSGIGRDKVEGVLYEARPVLIHLINLEFEGRHSGLVASHTFAWLLAH